MTIEELDKELENSKYIIENWALSCGEIEKLPEAIIKVLDENRVALIKYLKEKE